MPTTSGGLRYPQNSDAVDVPGDMQKLANDIDSNIGAMRALTAQFYV